jgi:hypothetical protein
VRTAGQRPTGDQPSRPATPPRPRGVVGRILDLQRAAGNAAVGSLLAATRRVVQRDPTAPDATAGLDSNFWLNVKAKQWQAAAHVLVSYPKDEDITGKVIVLDHDQLIALDAAARLVLKDKAPRVTDQIRATDGEADRVGLLTYQYDSQFAARNWEQALIALNGFNDTDITAKVSPLAPGIKSYMVHVASGLAAVGGGSGRLHRLLSAIAGVEVEVRQDEQVGGRVYTVEGRYTWRITPDAIVIDVGMDFRPDTGVTVPTSTWFGYIDTIWNHYSAVNQSSPGEKKEIKFHPFQGAGHTIQVSAGSARANAAHYFAGSPTLPTTVPHEFGHLIGLEDEYERDAADHQRVSEAAPLPAAAPADLATAQTIAREMHSALFLEEKLLEWHRTAERRRMAAVDAVLAAHHIIPNYHAGGSTLNRHVALQYRQIFGAELSAHFMSQIDTDNDEFNGWREKVLGSFQFTSTSIMGDKSDHTHPVEPRHVRAFAGYVQQALGRGVWVPLKDH